MKNQFKAQVILVTGQRGSGKTIFCTHIARMAQSRSWNVKGVLSHAVFKDGQKTAIEVEELSSDLPILRPLASLRKKEQSDRLDKHSTFGKWQFEPDCMSWVNEVFQKATPCDLLIVDEVGPLEFERGNGWQDALEALDRGRYHYGLVTIRPDLLETAAWRWKSDRMIYLENIETVPDQVIDLYDWLVSSLGKRS